MKSEYVCVTTVTFKLRQRKASVWASRSVISYKEIMSAVIFQRQSHLMGIHHVTKSPHGSWLPWEAPQVPQDFE